MKRCHERVIELADEFKDLADRFRATTDPVKRHALAERIKQITLETTQIIGEHLDSWPAVKLRDSHGSSIKRERRIA